MSAVTTPARTSERRTAAEAVRADQRARTALVTDPRFLDAHLRPRRAPASPTPPAPTRTRWSPAAPGPAGGSRGCTRAAHRLAEAAARRPEELGTALDSLGVLGDLARDAVEGLSVQCHGQHRPVHVFVDGAGHLTDLRLRRARYLLHSDDQQLKSHRPDQSRKEFCLTELDSVLASAT